VDIETFETHTMPWNTRMDQLKKRLFLEKTLREEWRFYIGESDVIEDVIFRYNESHRFHHNLQHIYDGTSEMHNIERKQVSRLQDMDLLLFAWSFHDYLWLPKESKLSV
jgi:predicted metal-dependent HD superfamily phosphohydrolase